VSDDPNRSSADELDARTVLIAVRGTVRAVAGWKIALGAAAALLPMLLVSGLFVAANSSAGGGQSCVVKGSSGDEIPADYVPWLEKAASRYHLGPRGFSIVAAIHKVESDFGRSPLPGVHSGTNSAGAAGPGQFLFSTWATYGVDATGSGRPDIYSIPDSIFATANYLHASGAPGNWRGAIFAYNHADWYVEEVLQIASSFGAGEVCTAVASTQLGEVPTEPLARIQYVARWIEDQRIHYCWGGGHATKPGPSTGSYCWSAAGRQVFGAPEKGLDCSGAVRWLLVLSGYKDPGPLVSGDFASTYPSGRGQHVTIWSNVDHVFVEIDGRDWGTSDSNFAHGPGFGLQSTAGFVANHPPGL
jgi:Transglycosylase SLT domain